MVARQIRSRPAALARYNWSSATRIRSAAGDSRSPVTTPTPILTVTRMIGEHERLPRLAGLNDAAAIHPDAEGIRPYLLRRAAVIDKILD